jgi:hypothetical protein
VLLVLPALLVLFGLVVLDVVAEDAHLLVELAGEVEVVELSEAQLAVVVVEALLGDTDQTGRVLQVESAVERLVPVQVQVPPPLHQLDHFRDAALLAAAVPLVRLAVGFEAGVEAI